MDIKEQTKGLKFKTLLWLCTPGTTTEQLNKNLTIVYNTGFGSHYEIY